MIISQHPFKLEHKDLESLTSTKDTQIVFFSKSVFVKMSTSYTLVRTYEGQMVPTISSLWTKWQSWKTIFWVIYDVDRLSHPL